MKVDRQSGVGLVEQVASILKREIAAGRYAIGEHLPSALALGKLVGASEKPVRGALRQLAAEGWVRPVRGVGFFTYGPQALVGVASANIATKAAAGTATGFTAVFGYLSTLVSGVGIGWVAGNFGWVPVLYLLAAAALCGLVLFLAIWNAASDGYGTGGGSGK